MTKNLLIIFLFLLSFNIKANQPEYVRALPTTYQEVHYAAETLKSYLIPLGYELNLNSVRISDGIAVSGINREVKVLNPDFSAKTVLFTAKELKTKKTVGGSIYLIIAVKNIKTRLEIEELNSTAKKFQTAGFYSNDQFYLLLSRGHSADSFNVDISPLDFKFHY